MVDFDTAQNLSEGTRKGVVMAIVTGVFPVSSGLDMLAARLELWNQLG